MGQEYAAKSRDFENLKQAYEELQRVQETTMDTLKQRNDELDSAHSMNRELQAHATTLLEKVTYQESVINDVEEKNKRLTDLLNQQLADRAQTYKEKVLSKLTERTGTPSMTPLGKGRPVSPFHDTGNANNVTTPTQRKRHGDAVAEASAQRLA